MVWKHDFFPFSTAQTDAVILYYVKLPILCLDSQMTGSFAQELPLETRATVRSLTLVHGGSFHPNSEISK